MNVLLVEDELLVRSGMKTIIDWDSYGFDLVADVSHGEEALKVLEQQSVDIVLTDIRMPVMDGLKLIETIREKTFPCEIIVLSSYDDFQYVRQAMKFGVRDYIHKPLVTPEELIKTLKKVADDLTKRRSYERYQQVIMDAAEESRELVLKKVARQALYAPLELDPKIAEMLEGHYVMKGTFYLGVLRIFDLHRLRKGQPPMVSEEDIIKAHCAVWNEGGKGTVLFFKESDDWVMFLPEGGLGRLGSFMQHVTDHFGLEAVCEVADKRCDITDLPDVYQRLCTKVCKRQLELQQQHELHPLIGKALSYIHENYMHNLTLEKVSSFIHVSPSYLSRLFYKELGETFIHYLTHYRLQQARDLLMQSDKHIYEIAKSVGYSNSKYFLKLFKKQFHLTPGEFRQKKG